MMPCLLSHPAVRHVQMLQMGRRWMGRCGWNGSGWVKLAARHSILVPSTGRIPALLLAACHFHFYTTLLLAWLIPSNPYLTLQSTHSFFPSSLLQEAHINKMLLHSCHLCPTTNLTVAECPVAAGAVKAFLTLNWFQGCLPIMQHPPTEST